MSLSSLLFTTGIDGSGFRSGLMSMKHEAAKAGKDISSSLEAASSFKSAAKSGSIFAVIAASLGLATKAAFDFQSAIDDAQDQFQLTAEDVQRISAIAKEAGTDVAAVANALDKISESRKKLIEGDKSMQDKFNVFGIPKDLAASKDVSSLQILRMMSDSINDPITEEQRRIFGGIAGESGKKLLRFTKDLKNQGSIVIVSDEQLKAIGKANDGFSRLWTNVKAMTTAGVGNVFGKVQNAKTFGESTAEILWSPLNFASGFFDAFAKATPKNQTPLGSKNSFGGFSDSKNEEEKAKNEKDKKEARRKIFGGIETRGGVDSLASVGLFVRGGAGSLVDVQRRQLDVLTRMEAMQRDLLRVTREVL